MKTFARILGLACAAAVARAQTNPPTVEPRVSASSTNLQPAKAASANLPPAKAVASDLERHPFRIFEGKRCNLLPLLAWERLTPAQRDRSRNPMPVWRAFHGTVVRALDPGMLFYQGLELVYVKDYPASAGLTNGQALAFHAIRYGTYAYTNAVGMRLRVAGYDYGVPYRPRVVAANRRPNLAELERARQLKAIGDRLAFLKKADDQLHEEEMQLKRIRANYRQTRRARAFEQFQIRRLETQRGLIRQQVTALKQEESQIEKAPGNEPVPVSGMGAQVATNSVGLMPTNWPGYARTNRLGSRL